MKIKINKNTGKENVKVYINDINTEENFIETNDVFNLKIIQHRLSSSNKDTLKTLGEIISTFLFKARVSYGNELISPAHAEWNGICQVEEFTEGKIEINIKVCNGSSKIEVTTQNIRVLDYSSIEIVSKKEKVRWFLMILCFLLPASAIIIFGLTMLLKTLLKNNENDSFTNVMIGLFVIIFLSALFYIWLKTFFTLKIKSSDKKNVDIDFKIEKAQVKAKLISYIAIISSILTAIIVSLGPFISPDGKMTLSLIFNTVVNIGCLIIVSNINDDFYNSSKKNKSYIFKMFFMFFITIITLLISLSFYK